MEELKVGDIIKERYALVRFLGSGSFGEVWLAHDQITGRDVALKIYLSLDPTGVEEFQREYSNTIDLSSPYLLTPDHFDVYGRRPFLVMKFCENGSASKLVGSISEDQIWNFISDVANGLAVLHRQSDPIVHQDIKPDNILIDGNGRFLITDFGISKRLRATMRRQSKRDVSSGAMPYMAPERFESNPKLTTASDIWSLGASIYELATGELPFSGFGGAMQRNGAEIPSLDKSFSNDINLLMRACLSSDPNTRPSAQEISDAATHKKYKGKSNLNTKRGLIIGGIILSMVVLCYGVYWLSIKINTDSSNILESDSTPHKIAAPHTILATDSENVDPTIKQKIMTDDGPNVPKPQKTQNQSYLPFDPSGCPYIYIQGIDKDAMLNKKSIKVKVYDRYYVLTLGDGSPNGTVATISYDKYIQNLIWDVNDEEEEIFDDFGFLNPEWNMQITLMDFNDDEECEVLLTIQSNDHPWGTKTYVYKLYPTPYKDSITKYIGEIQAYDKMHIEDSKIVSSHFREGLEEEYILGPNDKLICLKY